MVLSVQTGWTRTEILDLSPDELHEAALDLADILKPRNR